MSDRTIAATLNIDYIPKSQSVVDVKAANTAVVLMENHQNDIAIQEDKEAEEDFRLARAALKNVLGQGDDAIESALEVAKGSEKGRDFESVAMLLKTVADSAKDLYELHDKKKRFKNYGVPDGNVQNINVDKAVFVGSPQDNLKRLKAMRSHG